jgi:HAD superfamily hydrolase (TIGR01549 family)
LKPETVESANGGKLLVLDVDGVLIDPCGSFEKCAAMALNEIAPDLAWSDELYWRFKRISGFNNDFRLTAAAVALFEAGEIDHLSEGRIDSAQSDQGCGEAEPPVRRRAGGGSPHTALSEMRDTGFPHLEKRIGELEPHCKERVQFYYQSVKHLERPLITYSELEALKGWDVAILTGRPPEELTLAFEVLGFELPAVGDTCPEFRKPAPGGLIHLADTFKAKRVYFVGDTTDDATCLRRAREARPDLELTFVAVNKLRFEITQPEDLAYPALRDFVAFLHQNCVQQS